VSASIFILSVVKYQGVIAHSYRASHLIPELTLFIYHVLSLPSIVHTTLHTLYTMRSTFFASLILLLCSVFVQAATSDGPGVQSGTT
jgi:hypothetical protein